eukprot:5216293-Pyramimonas_sp.AAC.1
MSTSWWHASPAACTPALQLQMQDARETKLGTLLGSGGIGGVGIGVGSSAVLLYLSSYVVIGSFIYSHSPAWTAPALAVPSHAASPPPAGAQHGHMPSVNNRQEGV